MTREIALAPTGEAVLSKDLVDLLNPKGNKILCAQRNNILILVGDMSQLDDLKTFRLIGEATLERLWQDEDDTIWKSYLQTT